MSKIEKVLFTGKTHTVANYQAPRSEHGRYDFQLTSSDGHEEALSALPPHPAAERMFAGAWSACYSAALALVAAQKKIKLPRDTSVDIDVDLGQTGDAWFLQARFDVRIPGVAQDVAEALVHGAHEVCPYSKATRGNIDVAVNVSV